MSFVKITSLLNESNGTDKKIINAIIENSKDISNLTLTNIADMIPVSHSTVSRLIKKAGFNSWVLFIVSCKLEESFYLNNLDQSIIDKHYLQLIYTSQNLKNIELKLDKIVTLLKKSNTTIFYGYRLAGNIAQYLSFNFADNNLMCTHTYFKQDLYPLFRRNNLLVMLISQDKKDYAEIIQKALDNYTKIIIIDACNSRELQLKKDKQILYISTPALDYFKTDQYSNLIKAETLRVVGTKIFEKWNKNK